MKTFKNILKAFEIVGLILFVIFGCVYLFKQCNSDTTPPIQNNDSLYTVISEKEQIANYAIAENRIYKAKVDSLKKLKPKYIKGRDRVRDSLIYVSDSICINRLNLLYDKCQEIDSINGYIISNQFKTIQSDSVIIDAYKGIASDFKAMHVKDSTKIVELNGAKRKGYLKGLWHGALIGVAAKSGIDVISNLKK